MTVETLSSVRAGFLCGRGSIAWVVIPFNSNKAKKGSEVCQSQFLMASSLLIVFPIKFFVLMQSWLPREVDSEGKLYDGCLCDSVGKIELCEEVTVSGSNDATDTLIQLGLDDSMGLGKRSRGGRGHGLGLIWC